jgi:hypothetical protein
LELYPVVTRYFKDLLATGLEDLQIERMPGLTLLPKFSVLRRHTDQSREPSIALSNASSESQSQSSFQSNNNINHQAIKAQIKRHLKSIKPFQTLEHQVKNLDRARELLCRLQSSPSSENDSALQDLRVLYGEKSSLVKKNFQAYENGVDNHIRRVSQRNHELLLRTQVWNLRASAAETTGEVKWSEKLREVNHRAETAKEEWGLIEAYERRLEELERMIGIEKREENLPEEWRVVEEPLPVYEEREGDGR